ncbi:MAG: porin [Reyranellaceae bacterium]
MKLRGILLATTAATLATITAPQGVSAAEVKAGGALDLTISGFLRAEAGGGEQDDLQLDADKARGLDFRNDTEIHVLAEARNEETGLEYGATVKFEADTNQDFNTDETWLFIRGGWGEMRMGDQDGIVENSIVGGQTLASGTGGIDGSDFVILTVAGGAVYPTLTDDATKISYYTPSFSGFSLGVSFTPTQSVVDSDELNGDFIADKNGDAAMEGENVAEAGLIYDGELGEDIQLTSSLVGLYGKLRNGGEEAFGDDTWWSATYGAVLDISGIQLGGSVGTDHLGDWNHQFMTAGIGYEFGPVSTSLTYAWIWDSNDDFSEANGYDKPRELVLSAGYALAPGLSLQGDIAAFDNDTNDSYDGGTGDTGWAGVGRFEVAF